MIILMAGCFKWVKTRKEQRDIKLVIIGLDDAGKTTTIACLQGEPPDGITPTVGFSNAKMTIGKWNITIYDLGGGSGVRSVWQKYYAEVYGIIFTVDSGDHNRLIESKNVLTEIFADQKVAGKPVVVFANKQDKAGALSEQEVSEKLSLQELSKKYNFKFNVFSCSAIKGYGKTMDKRIKTGIEWLLNAIGQDYVTIGDKVTKEAAIQKEQELKERKERMERIKKIREEREKAAKEAGVVEEESDDDDVVVNPFRNINDQIEVTEKRERKAKEKTKKIKAYEMNKDQDSAESVSSATRSKKSNETYSDTNHADIVEDSDDNDTQSVKEFQNGDIFVKKKNKKNQNQKSKRKSDDESDESGHISPKKKGKSNENDSLHTKMQRNNLAKSKDIESDLVDECDKLNVDNEKIISVSDLKYVNASADLAQHSIIYVGSKESLRESSPIQAKSGEKRTKIDDKLCLESFCSEGSKDTGYENENQISSESEIGNIQNGDIKKKKSTDSDIHSYNIDKSTSSIQKTEKELNDSRAELFRARSTESLSRVDQDANCCNKNRRPKKKKKKKGTEVTEFHCVQDTEMNKKVNNIEPQSGCNSKNDSNKSDFFNEGFASSGPLPPLRGASKLEPIKLKGHLPQWSDT